MQSSFLSFVVTAATIGGALAQSANCEGSSSCRLATRNQVPLLIGFINSIPDSNFYDNGQLIACADALFPGTGSVCAFLQNSGGLGAGDIKPLAQDIADHGCTTCGSQEFTTGINGVFGLLTFNFVSKPGCNGVCK
ncbi:killer toxin [Mycena vulgaris]|nr:killer toxin [Mycena vulgaris]